MVADDDDAGADVAQTAGEEDERVDDGQHHRGHDVLAARSQLLQEEVLHGGVRGHVPGEVDHHVRHRVGGGVGPVTSRQQGYAGT